MEYNFDWSSPLKLDDKTLPADLLQRNKYAEALSRHIAERSGELGDYVLNLDASWGTGKTYFLRRWFSNLQDYNPTVYIDAWKHDFSDDPLLTVICELKKQINEKFDIGINAELFNKIGAVAKAGAPVFFKGLAKKFAGFDSDELADGYSSEMAGDFASKITTLMINNYEEQRDAIDDFRHQLVELADKVEQTGNISLPIVVFIDELDRCRPTFAIELLEAVKHLFDVPQFTFVIATDTEQLEHSVGAIYGQGFDSRRYLSRFFSERVTLPKQSTEIFLLSNKDFLGLLTGEGMEIMTPPYAEAQELTSALGEVLDEYGFSLRTVERMVSRFGFLLRSISDRNVYIDPLYLFVMMITRELSEQDYQNKMTSSNPTELTSQKYLVQKGLSKFKVSIRIEPEIVRSWFRMRETKFFQLGLDEVMNIRRREAMGSVNFRDEINANIEGLADPVEREVAELAILYIPDDFRALELTDYKELIDLSLLLQ